MPTETTPVEVITDDDKQLIAIVQQNGLQAETAQNLQAAFAPLFASARTILEKSRAVTVTDVSQKDAIKIAKIYRIELKNIRVAGDKVRKELKEESLKKGKAIDGFYNILDHLVSTEEARLTEQEKFAEIKEAQRKAALKTEREELLKPYGLDLTGYALGDMSAETFDQLLTGTKHVHEAKIEAARKAEADRIAKEAAEQAERIRIQAENERLRKEAEFAKAEADRIEKERVKAEQEAAHLLAVEKAKADEAAKIAAEIARKEREAIEAKAKAEREAIEAQAKKDREAADEAARQERLKEQALREVERQKAESAAKEAQAKLDAERQAREKIEAEQKKAKELEAARITAENTAKQKAAAAPDRDKLLAFAAAIKAVQIPTLQTETGIALTATIKASHDKFVNWINEKAGAL